MKLRLIMRDGKELICDEDGRPLENVRDFEYRSMLGDAATLKIVIVMEPGTWDNGLASLPERITG